MSLNDTQNQGLSTLPVTLTRADVEALKTQRELLRDFVSSQLKEASFEDKNASNYGEGDYGIIPGTKKRCLFKQGAEKLLRLFGYGVRFIQTDKEIDRSANLAMYTYRAEIYVIRSGHVIANSEGTANSQEDKFRERTVWKKNGRGGSESFKEEAPIFNVLNTLQKMAQKRALIAATLLATSASEYFTQDQLDPEDLVNNREGDQKPPPKDVNAEVNEPEPPMHCGQPMMLSKYVDKEFGHAPWYCLKCKAKLPKVSV
jgi:hypothetical protein